MTKYAGLYGDTRYEEEKRLGSLRRGESHLGWSLAASGDGRTLLAGSPYFTSEKVLNRGAVTFFSMSEGKLEEIQTIVGDGSHDDEPMFGNRVGLSSDGRTAFVTTGGRDAGCMMYHRTADDDVWKLRQILPGFARGTSISGDGLTLARAINNDEESTVIEIYEDQRGEWTKVQELQLTPSSRAPRDYLECSFRALAISADGSTIAVVNSAGTPFESAQWDLESTAHHETTGRVAAELAFAGEILFFERAESDQWTLSQVLKGRESRIQAFERAELALSANGTTVVLANVDDSVDSTSRDSGKKSYGSLKFVERSRSGEWNVTDTIEIAQWFQNDQASYFNETYQFMTVSIDDLAISADGQRCIASLGSSFDIERNPFVEQYGAALDLCRNEYGRWQLGHALEPDKPDPQLISSLNSVAISEDGTWAAIGSPYARSYRGEITHFELNAGRWCQKGTTSLKGHRGSNWNLNDARDIFGIVTRLVAYVAVGFIVFNAAADAISNNAWVLALVEVIFFPLTYLLYPFFAGEDSSAWPINEPWWLFACLITALVCYPLSTFVGRRPPV
jgi:hypothetical protein